MAYSAPFELSLLSVHSNLQRQTPAQLTPISICPPLERADAALDKMAVMLAALLLVPSILISYESLKYYSQTVCAAPLIISGFITSFLVLSTLRVLHSDRYCITLK